MTIIIVAIVSFIFGMMIMALLVIANDCEQSVSLEESRAIARAEFAAAKARISLPDEDDPDRDISPSTDQEFFDN